MKNGLLNLIRWFCFRLTIDDLASAIVVFQEILSGSRKDIALKPTDVGPPHYRDFRTDTTPPLTDKPEKEPLKDWKQLRIEYREREGKELKPVRRGKGAEPPPGCRCHHCDAPAKYLYMNNGKESSQVKCKICKKTSPTNKPRRESITKYWCPHCGASMYRWKETGTCIAYKCPNDKCFFYLKNLAALTSEEKQMRDDGKHSQFKLRYIYREYIFTLDDISASRPELDTPINFNRIHKNINVVGLCLSFSVSFGLSARMTRDVLKKVFNISISHQTVINYIKTASAMLHPYIDACAPVPEGTVSGDETYITVNGKTTYTWFSIDSKTRAICGYNISDTRGAIPALSLLYDTFGKPEDPDKQSFTFVSDGNPSYDNAVMAYNAKTESKEVITKHKVVGLQNVNEESRDFRVFKQLVERLNRTYKFHTRPRAGFKTFDGAVTLTTLFVGFYNFMRPHSYLKGKPPVQLDCLKGTTLYHEMWIKLLGQVA